MESELDVTMIDLQPAQDFIDQRLILDHEKVGIENARVLRADRFRDLLLHLEDLRSRLNERALEARDFVRDVHRVDLIAHDIVRLDREDMQRCTRDSRGGGHSLVTLFLVAAIAAHSGFRLPGASTILR